MTVNISYEKVENNTTHVYSPDSDQPTLACRVDKAFFFDFLKAAESEGFNRAGYLRQGGKLRLKYRDQDYYKLIYHHEKVSEFLKGLPEIMVERE